MLAIDQYKKLATIFSDEFKSHTPIPGDMFIRPHSTLPDEATIRQITAPRPQISAREIWAPNFRQLLLLAGDRGLRIGIEPSDDGYRAWIRTDESLKSLATDPDVAIFQILTQWSECRKPAQPLSTVPRNR